jgi:hypothetical protein
MEGRGSARRIEIPSTFSIDTVIVREGHDRGPLAQSPKTLFVWQVVKKIVVVIEFRHGTLYLRLNRFWHKRMIYGIKCNPILDDQFKECEF